MRTYLHQLNSVATSQTSPEMVSASCPASPAPAWACLWESGPTANRAAGSRRRGPPYPPSASLAQCQDTNGGPPGSRLRCAADLTPGPEETTYGHRILYIISVVDSDPKLFESLESGPESVFISDPASDPDPGKVLFPVTAVAQYATTVGQWAKAPGVHCYAAVSIPAITPRYCTNIIKMFFRAQNLFMIKKWYVFNKEIQSIKYVQI
jgi:hypothetical protein